MSVRQWAEPVRELDRRPFFTPATLAAYLAVTRRQVERMLRSGEIPSYKIAGARRIAADDVDAYLARCRGR